MVRSELMRLYAEATEERARRIEVHSITRRPVLGTVALQVEVDVVWPTPALLVTTRDHPVPAVESQRGGFPGAPDGRRVTSSGASCSSEARPRIHSAGCRQMRAPWGRSALRSRCGMRPHSLTVFLSAS